MDFIVDDNRIESFKNHNFSYITEPDELQQSFDASTQLKFINYENSVIGYKTSKSSHSRFTPLDPLR
jgi:hypothetical protein